MMNIREELEAREEAILSPFASLSSQSRGRVRPEPQCDIRPVFQRDRDRILHCKSFRRLKQKTQVFLLPKGDHYRTRLTHTLEVSQNARTIAKALRLNEDLVEAIALGHDLGHTPFGHAGERALAQVCPEGFRHDIDDAIRGGILTEADLPRAYTDVLGHTTRMRLNTMIHDVVTHSMDQPRIIMSERVREATMGLRRFLFENVYQNPVAKGEETKAIGMIQNLYAYYLDHMDQIPRQYLDMTREGKATKERVVCDYIAGMTDSYAVKKFQEYFIPESWKN